MNSERKDIAELIQRTGPDPIGATHNRPPADVPGNPPGVPPWLFPVLIWRDGGDRDGNFELPCNRTYKARTLDATGPDAGGELLGEELTPTKTRPSFGMLWCPPATGAGVIGYAYYDKAGAFRVYDANETLAPV
jgi:hypothetical protein